MLHVAAPVLLVFHLDVAGGFFHKDVGHGQETERFQGLELQSCASSVEALDLCCGRKGVHVKIGA